MSLPSAIRSGYRHWYDVMYERRFAEAVKERFGRFNSLNAECLAFCGEVLAEVQRRFNSEEKLKRGVREAFRETIIPPGESFVEHVDGKDWVVNACWHSQIRNDVDYCEQENLEPVYDANADFGDFYCKHGCGYRWEKKSTERRAYQYHTPHKCWFRRKDLQPPFAFNADPNDPDRSLGRAFEVTHDVRGVDHVPVQTALTGFLGPACVPVDFTSGHAAELEPNCWYLNRRLRWLAQE